ncbi:MAG: class I SAM-dependent methyltransferase [Deltaproteobacteria bacterium]|nr:class I SAM-dependent methyltransferase [Deltaproteobacteria bacterium]NND26960.1 class I SAM-dependent methyltransferase [Myxococcales bacterium]MBT8467091.1 class I SAM-dependent methyltransferase [Deltaproteobacteria bacterium]MBT8483592.1 class I SAM-dependent methyltransferase [Deltaproteobacteria bacterium]NNK42856.1 class I SAM-dependent methyltransferase [Myxococcales bacterium]
MNDAGQVTATAAEVYDEFFLPALFAAWPPRVVAAAALRPGQRVVDVACGTGVLAAEAARATSPGGYIVGVDVNPGMLAVARRKAPDIDWLEAPAEALPFEAESFDAAVSQFGLMFFEDKQAATAEMWRVIRPGGRLTIAVWDSLEHTPGYSAVTSLLARLFGDDVAALLQSPYSLGNEGALGALLERAGVSDPKVRRVPGEACFPSIRAWMHSDVRGWTLADRLDDEQYERLVAQAEVELNRFVTTDGSVRFAHPALIVTAQKS